MREGWDDSLLSPRNLWILASDCCPPAWWCPVPFPCPVCPMQTCSPRWGWIPLEDTSKCGAQRAQMLPKSDDHWDPATGAPVNPGFYSFLLHVKPLGYHCTARNTRSYPLVWNHLAMEPPLCTHWRIPHEVLQNSRCSDFPLPDDSKNASFTETPGFPRSDRRVASSWVWWSSPRPERSWNHRPSGASEANPRTPQRWCSLAKMGPTNWGQQIGGSSRK